MGSRSWTSFAIRACGAVALLVSACTSDESAALLGARGAPGADGGTSSSGDAAPDGSSTAQPPPPPPFSCTPSQATSPVLAGHFLFDPKDPHPGDTVTVLFKSADGHPQSGAPDMTLDVTTAKGTSTEKSTTTAGGSGVIYYFAVPDVQLGDVCLLSRIGGAAELAGKVTVTPRPATTSAVKGVFKVTTNHQFTCQEQPTFGNELHVSVLDAQGHGVPGAVVDVRLPDTTDTASIKNAADKPVPTTLTMNAQGAYDDYFWWPSNGNGLTVFELSVRGAASDKATEISSGWWETDPSGCNYCNTYAVNVYGHWSHRIVFQLDPAATQACLAPSDHAGQTKCPGHGHVHHHPTHQACWPVGP